jgi:arylsulfatase A-like enzyme
MEVRRHGGLIFVSWCCVVAFAVGSWACRRKPPDAMHDAGGMDSSSTSTAPSTAAVDAAPAIPGDLNVVVLSVDSLRGDMPWNGYPRPIAPRLTELAKRSVNYSNAYAISSYTSMSLGGLLGGRLPSGMPRSGFFFGRYAPDNVMFPELLQQAGIRTVAAHAHGYFKEAGFDQGFDVWEVVPNIVFKAETDPNVTSPAHAALAEKILGEVPEDKRFFAWFHFLDPHDAYMGHEKDGIPSWGSLPRDRYDGEVTFTDKYLGKLIDFIEGKPWGKKTAIILTSDHGESFGEHGRYAHGFELFENLVRVPLFFVVPGAAPRTIAAPRGGLDLAPTICELLGVKPAPSFEGTSLVPELLGAPAEERDVLLDLPMTSDNDKRRALVHGNKKIIAYGATELPLLYDLDRDPKEDKPIQRGELFTEMARRYRAASKAITEVAPYACGEGCLNRAYLKSQKKD